jgi:hypothetical protein
MRQLPKEITEFLNRNNFQTPELALASLKFEFDHLKQKIEITSMIHDDLSSASQALRRMKDSMNSFKP